MAPMLSVSRRVFMPHRIALSGLLEGTAPRVRSGFSNMAGWTGFPRWATSARHRPTRSGGLAERSGRREGDAADERLGLRVRVVGVDGQSQRTGILGILPEDASVVLDDIAPLRQPLAELA